MIRIFLGYEAPVVKLEWSIYKGASGVKEDFTNANVFLWMIGGGDKFLVECTTEDGVIKAVIPNVLPEGVYGLRTMWVKDDNCGKRCMSEVEKVFAVTHDPTQATPVVGDSCTIKVKSSAATYGYDGLSAYEMSVLKGKTIMSEEEWLVWQNGIPAEVSDMLDGRFLQEFGNEEHKGISQKVLTETKNDLQDQINAIVSGIATVSLSASPSPIFVGEQKNISLVAGVSVAASSITIKKGGSTIASGSGTSLSGSDTITPSSAGDTNYTAEFVIGGLTKTASKAVTAVFPIRIGSGASYVNGTPLTTPKTSPVGTYNITVAHNADYVWFNVPSTMSIGRATMGGFEFPLEAPVNVNIGDVPYKSYRSSNTYDAGSYEIVIESV